MLRLEKQQTCNTSDYRIFNDIQTSFVRAELIKEISEFNLTNESIIGNIRLIISSENRFFWNKY